MKLNNKKCETASREKDGAKLFDGGGLFLELHKNGSKYWRYKYRALGKEKVLALGVYPEISLAEAREKHREAHKLVAQGLDPSLEKQNTKRERILNAENTFEVIAREWYDHSKDVWSENHARTILRRLELDVFPMIGRKPIRDITPLMLLEVIRAIEQRSAFEMARRALQMSGQVFRYAIINGKADRDPTQDLKGSLKPYKKGHYAAMEAKDLPEFLSKLHSNEGRLFPTTQLAIEMMMLTFVRTGELIKAKWDEFDFDEKVWIIPAPRMKMRKDHIVALSEQVLECLKRLKEINGRWDYVFASQRTPRNHMSNNAILVALDRMGYRGEHTGHGFRALAMSTIKEKLGYRHEVIDRQLAHAHKSQIDAAYDRAQFLDERKNMMQDWADYLDKVQNGKVLYKLNIKKEMKNV